MTRASATLGSRKRSVIAVPKGLPGSRCQASHVWITALGSSSRGLKRRSPSGMSATLFSAWSRRTLGCGTRKRKKSSSIPSVRLSRMTQMPSRGKSVPSGGSIMVPSAIGASGAFSYPIVVMRSRIDCQRARMFVSASMTMPTVSPSSLAFIRTGTLSSSLEAPPCSLISSRGRMPWFPQMCFMTCSSSTPSTNRILRFAISTHLDLVAGRNGKLVFREYRWDDDFTLRTLR